MNSVMPLTSECSSRFSTSQSRHSSPTRSWTVAAVAGVAGGRLEQSFGGIGAAGEHDVLAQLAQLGLDLLVDRQLAGVDDAEPHPVGDGVVEEHRVHRLADAVVAAERERQVRHAARDVATRGSARRSSPVASMKSSP